MDDQPAGNWCDDCEVEGNGAEADGQPLEVNVWQERENIGPHSSYKVRKRKKYLPVGKWRQQSHQRVFQFHDYKVQNRWKDDEQLDPNSYPAVEPRNEFRDPAATE